MKLTTEQILERVRKLMALATSENESEAAAAMAKARQILQENGLKIEDIQAKTNDTKGIEVSVETGKKVRTSWMIVLGGIIADFFDCKCIFTSRTVSFIGLASDAEVAGYTFDQAKNRIEWLAYLKTGEYTRKMAEVGIVTRYLTGSRHPKAWRNSWMTGFLYGLKTQLREEKARQTAETVSTALVLRKSEIVQATTMELYPQLNDVVLQMNDRNSSALSQGAGEGEEFSLWKGLNTPSVGGLLED